MKTLVKIDKLKGIFPKYILQSLLSYFVIFSFCYSSEITSDINLINHSESNYGKNNSQVYLEKIPQNIKKSENFTNNIQETIEIIFINPIPNFEKIKRSASSLFDAKNKHKDSTDNDNQNQIQDQSEYSIKINPRILEGSKENIQKESIIISQIPQQQEIQLNEEHNNIQLNIQPNANENANENNIFFSQEERNALREKARKCIISALIILSFSMFVKWIIEL
jgi:hypothetical protein